MPSRLALLLVFFVCPSARSAGGGTITYTVNVSAGWNLLSLPVQVADGASGTVFPDAISNAIIFNGGYASLDTLKKGLGFWMKFASADTIPVAGGGMFIDSLNLRAGWNLIGGLTTPVAVNLIVTEPPGIVGSKFFRYVPGSGYAQTDTLQPGYGYWVRANRAGRLHMMARNVPCPGLATLAYGGRTYHTVQIGEQCWFRENLDIGEWVEGGVPQEDNGLTEKYCFNDEVVNCLYYGGLYQWNEAMQFSTAEGAQGICPPGWHVPTQGGFTELISSVRGDGNALKALRQGLEDGIGTNTSGFSALLAGYRLLNGYFSFLRYNAYFWS
ncbi:MAG TPA: FISUMP domain-containing protein, partial [Bacteroidota bacterium]|nr:FISUMP domain-containing protein [Bacteroidota bacterium]